MPIPRIEEFKLQITHDPGDGKFLAKVLRVTGHDQREGTSYATVASALDSDRDTAVASVVREAFPQPFHDPR